MRSPSRIVGFIDPVGTSFQSAKLDRAASRTAVTKANGTTCRRKAETPPFAQPGARRFQCFQLVSRARGGGIRMRFSRRVSGFYRVDDPARDTQGAARYNSRPIRRIAMPRCLLVAF